MKSKNKINIITILSCFALAFLFSSCKKDFLNLRPFDKVSADVAISNVSDMQAAVSGAYNSLESVNLYGRTIPLFGDLVADNVIISTKNSNRYLDFFQINYTVNNGNALGVWQNAYTTILRANNVINSSLSGTTKIDQLRGEAESVRALMYFELVKFFAKPYITDPTAPGVPIVLTYDPTLKPTRNTVTEVYTQIEKDLTDAANLMTEDKSSGFFTKYAAKDYWQECTCIRVNGPKRLQPLKM